MKRAGGEAPRMVLGREISKQDSGFLVKKQLKRKNIVGSLPMRAKKTEIICPKQVFFSEARREKADLWLDFLAENCFVFFF